MTPRLLGPGEVTYTCIVRSNGFGDPHETCVVVQVNEAVVWDGLLTLEMDSGTTTVPLSSFVGHHVPIAKTKADGEVAK